MYKLYRKSGSVFTDFSKEVGDYHSAASTITMTAATDALYIGSRFPFSSKYFKISSAPSPAISVTLQYYAGSGHGFKDVSSTEDGTDNLSQSGTFHFVPDRDFGIVREDTENIDELNTLVLYDLFWYKITVDSDTTFDLGWLGSILSNDDQLGSRYPDLNRASVKAAFESGKTDWEEQAMEAAMEIERDLVSRQSLADLSQLIDTKELRSASVAKTAEIIYSGLGQDFEDQALKARDRYELLISKPPRFVDRDGNARLTRSEYAPRVFNLRR